MAGDGGTEKLKSQEGAPLMMDDAVDKRRTSCRWLVGGTSVRSASAKNARFFAPRSHG